MENKKIFITGINGFIGSQLKEVERRIEAFSKLLEKAISKRLPEPLK